MKALFYKIIFEHDTKAGRLFDIILLWLILTSVSVVIFESMPAIRNNYFMLFYIVEWGFTIIFTIEYILRIWCSPRPWRYVFSFWGFIDLLSILPTYLDLLFFGAHYLQTVRILRLLRVFRILKLAKFNKEAQILINAIKGSAYKILVFMLAVMTIVTIIGSMMYVIEGPENGFSSIPLSIYWAIVTVTTVGFGDIVPQTILGKILASISMLIGYAIIAVPTGIITFEMSRKNQQRKECEQCGAVNNNKARYCNRCGHALFNQNS